MYNVLNGYQLKYNQLEFSKLFYCIHKKYLYVEYYINQQ